MRLLVLSTPQSCHPCCSSDTSDLFLTQGTCLCLFFSLHIFRAHSFTSFRFLLKCYLISDIFFDNSFENSNPTLPWYSLSPLPGLTFPYSFYCILLKKMFPCLGWCVKSQGWHRAQCSLQQNATARARAALSCSVLREGSGVGAHIWVGPSLNLRGLKHSNMVRVVQNLSIGFRCLYTMNCSL